MLLLSELFARMQSEATGCVAVLTVHLQNGALLESCGEDPATGLDAVAGTVRELFAPRHAALPQILAPAGADPLHELIALAGDRAYVCQRLADPPHVAVVAVCRDARNLGLVVGLLHQESATS